MAAQSLPAWFGWAAAMALCVAAFAGCSNVIEKPVEGGPAVPPPGIGFEDTNGGASPSEEKVCADGTPCEGGVCLPDEHGGEFCAVGCAGACPPGTLCKLVAHDGEFPKPYCLDIQSFLCNPCITDSECNLSVDAHFNRCVDHGSAGSFCASNCGDNGASCPAGYGCQEIEGVDGVKSEQCLPLDGQCSCSPYAVANALTTACAIENEHGTCTGSRQCTSQGLGHCASNVPLPETCNALDDDCDGYIDEGVKSPCGGCAASCDLAFEPKGAVKMGPSQNPFGDGLTDIVNKGLPIIWIANSGDNTTSRLNTSTGCEEARFYTCGDPSRTAVDADANGYIGCRSGGQLMKIATQENLCVDQNGNGIIDTSRDLNGDCKITPDEMFQGDECVLWSQAPPGASALRGAGVDADGNIWVGDSNNPHLHLMSTTTGATLVTHPIGASPYGLAIDADGIIWVASRNPHSLTRVHPQNGETGQWPVPTGDAYGIAIDPYGKIWVASYTGGGAQRFDPVTQTWMHLAGAGTSGRGVAVRLIYGANNQVAGAKVYVANSSQPIVDIFDAVTLQHEGHVSLGSNHSAVGVALDLEGFLWVVNQGASNAHKIDTSTHAIVGTYPVGGAPYTYSDMTGYAFHTITSIQGVHSKVFEGWEGQPTSWDSVSVEADLPADSGAYITIGYRAADTVEALKSAPWEEPEEVFPPAVFPYPIGLEGRLLEVRVHLVTPSESAKPKLQKVSVTAHKL